MGKKNLTSSAVFILLLIFALTGCGDEFGSMSVSNDTYIMFSQGNEPVRVEVMSNVANNLSLHRHDMAYLSATTEYGHKTFEFYQKEYNTSDFIKQYDLADPKPEVYFLFNYHQLSTRRNYAYQIIFFFTDSTGTVEQEEITINIPYLEGGVTKKMDLLLETKSYGTIPVLFFYYFTRSI